MHSEQKSRLVGGRAAADMTLFLSSISSLGRTRLSRLIDALKERRSHFRGFCTRLESAPFQQSCWRLTKFRSYTLLVVLAGHAFKVAVGLTMLTLPAWLPPGHPGRRWFEGEDLLLI
jgi:hypothetical protein